jgi:hypothetical protein
MLGMLQNKSLIKSASMEDNICTIDTYFQKKNATQHKELFSLWVKPANSLSSLEILGRMTSSGAATGIRTWNL